MHDHALGAVVRTLDVALGHRPEVAPSTCRASVCRASSEQDPREPLGRLALQLRQHVAVEVGGGRHPGVTRAAP